MDFRKNREIINKLLIDINNCKNSEEFYMLCTKLYYRVNETVFYFENKKLKVEEKENVSDNRTDCD